MKCAIDRSAILSIVIPVYNKEQSIERCVDSVMSQVLDEPDCFEILLVNDGSTDGSADICKKLEATYEIVRFQSQENQGVSAARNAGVQMATGRYVLFLDADDELGPNAAISLIDAFSRYDSQIDLMTYPITYIDSMSGSERAHGREKWFDGTGVYSLLEYPHICQTTINVCVKREVALRHPFSKKLKMGEDQLFNTAVLSERARIGYCAEASYRYYRDGTGESSYLNKPLYIFNRMTALYEALLAIGDSNPLMREYCRQMVLCNFGWRISSGSLFPDFGSSEDREKNYSVLADIVRSISLKSILNSKYLKAGQKALLAKKFELIPADAVLEYGRKHALVLVDQEIVWKTGLPNIRILRCIHDGHERLLLMAVLESPVFAFDKRDPKLVIKLNDERDEVRLVPSSFEYSGAREKTIQAWRFEVSIPLAHMPVDISFELTMSGVQVGLGKVITQFTRSNSRVAADKRTRFFSNCIVETSEDNATMRVDPIESSRLEKELARDARRDESLVRMRSAIRKKRHAMRKHEIWLYSDLPSSTIKNNALIQLLHDIKQNDKVDRYYVTEHVEELESNYPELRGHVVEYRSDEHLWLYMCATMILASYLDTPTFTPCTRKTYDRLGDLSNAKTMVYLQHGVLHAHMPWYFAYDRKLFDYEVVSSQFEIDNLIENCYFDHSHLIASGAPRFDTLKTDSAHEKRIVYAPSWRSYLIGGNANGRVPVDDRFLQSAFYQGMVTFVQDVTSSGLLDYYGYTLELKLHPNFQSYEEYLPVDGDRVIVAPSFVEESSYAVMVTDYSSYLYDFLYAGSRILRYLPDRREFEGGANHYSKLDWPDVAKLGPIVEDARVAVEELGKMLDEIENGDGQGADCSANDDAFFLHVDNCNAERLYNALMELAVQPKK